MCAQFLIKTTSTHLERLFEAKNDTYDVDWNLRVVPFGNAPVVVHHDKKNSIRNQQFSLIPNWSKERKPRFASYNARLFSTSQTGEQNQVPIYKKPVWCQAFRQRHCVVPLTHFIEPIYFGSWAGNMVKFSINGDGLLFAAGIWDQWTDPVSGEVIESFAIITDAPYVFVQQMGHSRSPIFLDPPSCLDWLENKNPDEPELWLRFLIENKCHVELQISQDRALKEGWQKRILKGP